MQTVLFHSVIFGPIRSRRLGSSLGVNLSPTDGKICSFDCLYCEAGFNAQGPGTSGLPSREEVRNQLDGKLRRMKSDGHPLDVITFSGNGEPTLHPDFEGIIDDTLALRDMYFPGVKVSVLSNSTRLGDPGVVRALNRVDNNILKLDSAIDATMRLIDRPGSPEFTVERAIEGIAQFRGKAIVQSMLLRGEIDGIPVNNTTDDEIDALIEACRRIAPESVMLYSIDRQTPCRTLHKVERDELEKIAGRFRSAGLDVKVN
ncbi:MAG: radical SAM protein [Paramuribaculum sp.]|nr:radical SAM protein [Paramuribaculum sp.]